MPVAFVATTSGGRLLEQRAVPAGFGPLTRLLEDPRATDVVANGTGGVWVDRGSGFERAVMDLAEPELRRLAVSLVALGGRHVDEASPCVDVRLEGGIRIHVVLPPVATAGTLISIRIPAVGRIGVDDERLRALVAGRANLLISGATGSGKTTLLSALLSLADPRERIVTIEDVAELRPDHPHVVALEARQANLEGAGEVGLARLLREALRMRPDRLVLGECRGAEIRELLSALNTGHDGGAGTLHANSLADVPARLEALGALAGLSPEAVARQAASAIGAVVHLSRATRAVEAIGRLVIVDDRLAVAPW